MYVSLMENFRRLIHWVAAAFPSFPYTACVQFHCSLSFQMQPVGQKQPYSVTKIVQCPSQVKGLPCYSVILFILCRISKFSNTIVVF